MGFISPGWDGVNGFALVAVLWTTDYIYQFIVSLVVNILVIFTRLGQPLPELQVI
jgi:hypothetical protein